MAGLSTEVKINHPATEQGTLKRALIDVGRDFHGRGWSLATSSNYSVVLGRDPIRMLITASGKHKDQLQASDFVVVDENGQPVKDRAPRPSAETLLHIVLAQQTSAGAVLHTHSVWSTLLSQRHAASNGEGELVLEDFEMLKGLAGVTTHRHRLSIPIFNNTQEIPALAKRLERCFDRPGEAPSHALLLRRHGLYTWGQDLAEARRHVEVLEFLLEVVGRSGP